MPESEGEQEWMIMNVDSHETLFPTGRPLYQTMFGMSGPGRYNNNQDVTAYLIRLLADPYPNPSARVRRLFELSSQTSTKRQTRSLLFRMLPPELLYTIIDQLHADALADKGAGEMAIYCLALTCRLFFRLTKNYVRVWSLGRTTRWMGGRIVCIGSRTRPKGLPRGMLRPDEHQHMLRSLDDSRHGYPAGRLGEKYADLTLIDRIAWRTVSVITWRKQVSASLSELQDSTARRLPQEDAETLIDYLTPYYEPRDDWVLYNKDTREYVRARAVAELCGQPDAEQPFLATCAVNLGDVLLSRICWSSERPPSITVAGRVHEVHRGVWAGHRFRISTMERLGSLLGRDVSEEVVGEMEAVWKGWHGLEWGWPSMPAVPPWFRPDANE